VCSFILITMRDSPNGKRYGRRDARGNIVEAYGFDLSPIAARHAELVRMAEEACEERELMGRQPPACRLRIEVSVFQSPDLARIHPTMTARAGGDRTGRGVDQGSGAFPDDPGRIFPWHGGESEGRRVEPGADNLGRGSPSTYEGCIIRNTP
jgi:hypothetical protein